MAEAKAVVSEGRRISAIWIVPIVAVVLGIWMVIYTYRTQGPEITIRFSTAAGIEAGKTEIKARSVSVGIVETVTLSEDLESVRVTAQMTHEAIVLLREDTEFWVVRPRVGMGGVSGLGTLLSGGYIELSPGEGKPGRREFQGLDEIPVTPIGAPGLKVTIVSEHAASLSVGDPVLYRGFRVGRVESADFDVASRRAVYGAFIEEPYDALVDTSVRFWNAGGVSLHASAEGVEVSAGSLQSILFGGVAFGRRDPKEKGEPVPSGTVFVLHTNREAIYEESYRQRLSYVVAFDQSVRGLVPGAPVEYRGVRAGTVERIMLREMVETGSGRDAISVLIRLEPGRLEMGDTPAGAERLAAGIEQGVANGLRAGLALGSLLTGRLYVAIDLYDNVEPASVGEFVGLPVIPSVSTGLAQMQQQVATVLGKIEAAPIEDLVTSADSALAEIAELIASEDVQRIPEELNRSLTALRDGLASLDADSELQQRLTRTLGELEQTMRDIQRLSRTIEQRPNSLIFPVEPRPDPEPRAGPR